MGTMRVDEASLTAVADAIREKAGSSEGMIFPEGFVSAVAGFQAGGGDNVSVVDDTLFGYHALKGTVEFTEDTPINGYSLVIPITELKEKFGSKYFYISDMRLVFMKEPGNEGKAGFFTLIILNEKKGSSALTRLGKVQAANGSTFDSGTYFSTSESLSDDRTVYTCTFTEKENPLNPAANYFRAGIKYNYWIAIEADVMKV